MDFGKGIAVVVVQFINITDFEAYDWNLSKISIDRIVKILK